MNLILRLSFFLALFSLIAPQNSQAAMYSDAAPKQVVTASPSTDFRHHVKTARHERGFWKNIKFKWKSAKAALRQKAESQGEKASTLAKLALYLFAGSMALNLLVSLAFTNVAPAVSAIISIAFLASLVISLIILFSDENRKSKAIAKTILIITGVMVLLAILLLAVVIIALSGW